MYVTISVSQKNQHKGTIEFLTHRFVLFSNVAKTMKVSNAAVKYAAMQQMSLTVYCLQDGALHFAAQGP